MDGPWVAYDVASEASRPCNRVYVWNVLTGKTTVVSGKQTCHADESSTGSGVRELAVAAPQVAWIVNQGGISESRDQLYTSSFPRPKERRLETAIRTGEASEVATCGGLHAGGLAGTWIGCLVGNGGFLAVNRWSTDTSDNVTSRRLSRIGTSLRRIVPGPGSMDAVSTDGKQVAVLRANGSVGLYSTAGKLLRVVTPSTAEEGARGDYVVALTKANTLEVFNSHSGKRLHVWRVAQRATFLDVSSKMAAYAAPLAGGRLPNAVHVLRLPSGKDRIVARNRVIANQIRGVELEPTGLAYARFGRVVFIPMSRLLR